MSVITEERTRRRVAAAKELAPLLSRSDAAQVVARLDDGMSLLRNLFYTRLQADVQPHSIRDSMLMPLSPALTEHHTKGEIEAFMVAEIVDELAGWAALTPAANNHQWLLDLRLASRQDRAAVESRADCYLRLAGRQRQLDFSDRLEKTFHEARHAPLVLYQLFPLAVRAVAALAFGDHLRGGEIRNKQAKLLPAITYCRNCHGRLMEVDETCRECGNPLWTIRWVTQME
jgi:hypothetical protein